MIKKYTTFIFSIILMITCFTGCKAKKKAMLFFTTDNITAQNASKLDSYYLCAIGDEETLKAYSAKYEGGSSKENNQKVAQGCREFLYKLQYEKGFYEGQKVNFIVLNPKNYSKSTLRIQILKLNENSSELGYSLAHGRDIRVNVGKNVAYNSFVLYKEGYYLLRVFSPEDFNKPLAEADFRIFEL